MALSGSRGTGLQIRYKIHSEDIVTEITAAVTTTTIKTEVTPKTTIVIFVKLHYTRKIARGAF